MRLQLLLALGGFLIAASGATQAERPRKAVRVDPVPLHAVGGPDIVASAIHNGNSGILSYGSNDPGDGGGPIAVFAIGTTACNVGVAPLAWEPSSGLHPVIRQNMYRLHEGRFEQLGTSWVAHGFLSVNEDNCGGGCAQTGAPTDELRPNCSSPESAAINGSRAELGPAYEVNAFTGAFPVPQTAAIGSGAIAHRIQIRHSDLDPTLNSAAVYFAEGHYVHPEDAAAGNGENNASYRAARVIPMTPVPCNPCICTRPYCMLPESLSLTQVGRPAIRDWKAADGTVRETDVRVPGEGLFILAQKTTELGTGFWRYEYALYNMNSHRSAGAFSVPVPAYAIVENVEFHDVDYHSGEIWDSTDWTYTFDADAITWHTTPYAVNPNANALRWGTLYNFRFDANLPPRETVAAIELFRPGSPDSVAVRTNGPAMLVVVEPAQRAD